MKSPTRSVWRIHLGLVLAELICVPAFIFEITRAVGGNTLSWAYVVEWPLLGGYAVYMWRQLLHQERHGTVSPDPVTPSASEHEALARWNEYLQQVHARDPGANEN